METNMEVNSMEDVVSIINDMGSDQEFILNIDCFTKEEDGRERRE